MKMQGCNCSILIKTEYSELDIPYSEETIRDAISVLQEEASIEGDGTCKAIRKKSGVTGCVVTSLTIGTAPLLLYLAMGAVGLPVLISQTRSLYRYSLCLIPQEDTEYFNLVQDRGGERKYFERCFVQGFELRFEREQAIKLKLDVCGDAPSVIYPYADKFEKITEERFYSDNVKYLLNGKEYKNIYGITLLVKKESGTKTEIWIKRSLEQGSDLPEIIDEFVINAQLLRDKYEYSYYGAFKITLKRLVLISNETNVNNSDTVISPLRYYTAGTVSADVFSTNSIHAVC
ncbi:MAG: biotin transporter BioY [Treponema sp.]|nr:biotin transporter BioY [Treponema sp.]